MKTNLSIDLHNVTTHNLKSISVSITHGTITVVTGLSGSGKSSLAIDTLYAEGQRRYIESLSPYTRQFLERMERPPVERISGILPAICIEAKNVVSNARSTVGTQTEINDYLRLLFARIGTMYCHSCEREVKVDTVEMIAHEVMEKHEGAYAAVIFSIPVQKTSQADIKLYIQELTKQGYSRLFINNDVVDIEKSTGHEELLKKQKHIDVVLDRIKLNTAQMRRLVDSLSVAYERGHDQLKVALFESSRFTQAFTMLHRSARFGCVHCGLAFQKPEPNLFSFNSAIGACPECEGFGRVITLDPDLMVPNRDKTLREGAIEPWEKPSAEWEKSQLMTFCKKEKIPLTVPFKKLTKSDVKKIFEGVGGKSDYFSVNDFFAYLERKKYKMHVRVFLSRYRKYVKCSQCHGARVRDEALHIKINGTTVFDVQCMTIHDAYCFFKELPLTKSQHDVVDAALLELTNRLHYLDEVGLGYLTLDRMSRTLSGGEMQRINLATALGTQLVDTLYVLDEPSIGLHERDNQKLINILQHLKKLGNTIVLIEHDAHIINVADQVIDLGPGAGVHGGHVMYSGDRKGLISVNDSYTAQYLRGEETIALSREATMFNANSPKKALAINNAHEHNLKGITVSIPLEEFVVVTGVSGAGKSTLVYDVLYKNYLKHKGMSVSDVGAVKSVKGYEKIDDIVFVDQSTLGRSLRSCPVTYTGVYADIRKLFASTHEARVNGFEPRSFSFNTKDGRCEKCEGVGAIKEEMHFLADVFLKCEHCDGRRFKKEVLAVRWNGKNIFDILQMTVNSALDFFKEYPAILRRLSVLEDVGLGYVTLGQSSSTLSAGEAQRMKLAVELVESKNKKRLYIFDEPTIGLHYHDIAVLMKAFSKLLSQGNSLLVIEHNLEVIKCADTIIDLGPESGESGGDIVFCGTPEECAQEKRSHTGECLKKYIKGKQKRRVKKVNA